MKTRNTWKKTLAFVMAFTLAAGALPVNFGDLLTGDTAIVAKAATGGQLGTATYTIDDHGVLAIGAGEFTLENWAATARRSTSG